MIKLLDARMEIEGERLDTFRQRCAMPTKEGDYVLTGRSLYRLAYCASAWRRQGQDEDTRSTPLTTAIWSLLLQPARATEVLAVRPERHRRSGLMCPSCKTFANSATCAKCGTTRVERTVDLQWSRNIAACRAWEEQAQQRGRVVIGIPDYTRATQAAGALSLLRGLEPVLREPHRALWFTGTLGNDEGQKAKVASAVAVLPDESTPYGDSVFFLYRITSAGIGPVMGQIYSRGYHCRAALGMDLVNRATQGTRRKARMLLANTGEGSEPALCELSQELLAQGRKTYQAGAAAYLDAIRTGHWRGFDHDGSGSVAWRTLGVEPWLG